MNNLPSDADSECPLVPIPALNYGHLAAQEAAGPVEDLMGVAVVSGRDAIVRMGVAHTVVRM